MTVVLRKVLEMRDCYIFVNKPFQCQVFSSRLIDHVHVALFILMTVKLNLYWSPLAALKHDHIYLGKCTFSKVVNFI